MPVAQAGTGVTDRGGIGVNVHVLRGRLAHVLGRGADRLEVEELRASRARVVAAADAERRRVERDLHDGIQQHLVALAVNIQLVRQLADSDPEAMRAVLDEIASDVREALESVRALAQTVYPPLLLDRGLGDALRAAVLDAGVPARLEID